MTLTLNDVVVDARDRELAATLHVLAAPSLAGRVETHVDLAERGIDFQALLEQPWSAGEQALIEIACTLWGHTDIADARLADLVFTLDDPHHERVLQAIQIRRGHAHP